MSSDARIDSLQESGYLESLPRKRLVSAATWSIRLDAESIESVLAALEPYEYGWRSKLPERFQFFGQPVDVTVETRPSPAKELPPSPSHVEVELVRLILAGISEVLAKAEQECAAYNADFPELLGKVCRPRVWVCREFQAIDGLDRWALTSGISDAPDWIIFVEFCGKVFVETWSGD